MVEKALHPCPGDSCGWNSMVLTSAFNLHLTRNDIRTVAGCNWLNDKVRSTLCLLLKGFSYTCFIYLDEIIKSFTLLLLHYKLFTAKRELIAKCFILYGRRL
jgi:hypothetical protein